MKTFAAFFCSKMRKTMRFDFSQRGERLLCAASRIGFRTRRAFMPAL